MGYCIKRNSNWVAKVLLSFGLSLASSVASAALIPQTIEIAPINGPFFVGQVVQLSVSYGGSYIEPTWDYFKSSVTDIRNFCTFTVDATTNIATVSLNHAGPCTLTAKQAGNAFYAPSEITYVPVTDNGTSTFGVMKIQRAPTYISGSNLPTNIAIGAVTAPLQMVVSYKSGAAQNLTTIANASNLGHLEKPPTHGIIATVSN